ncbi:MAG: GTP-binding protein [[Clostridium] innocuum]
MVRIEIISGFLGAGKTTFIKKLIHYHRNIKEKIVLIENEYGEAGIDGILLRKEEVESKKIICWLYMLFFT